MTESLTVLIVEDSAQSFFAVDSWLRQLGYQVLPQAFTIDDAEEALRTNKPDILLMDLDLEHDKPIQLKRLKESANFIIGLRTTYPHIAILVHSAEAKMRPEIVPLIMNAGISYLVKEAVVDAPHLDRAIRLAKTGAAVYDRHIVRYFDKVIPIKGESQLAPREWDVAALIGIYTYQEIAVCLNLSSDYVNDVVQSVYQKLGFNKQGMVARWYQRQLDLGNAPPPPDCRGKLPGR